jgi:predicted amidohydrolase YtcJ
MIDPYTDRPDTTGSLLVNASTLTTLSRQWAGAGFQVNIHAIGDLANRLAIDAMEAALLDQCAVEDEPLRDCQTASHRFRIEHAQIIHPVDQARMRELGIVPSIQPTHATSDSAYAGARLGEERVRAEAYRMRSVWDLGPVLGSDFPVEPANPFGGIYAAVTRRRPDTGTAGPDGTEGWCEEEALTLEQAIEGFTVAPARAGFMESTAGRVGKGNWADWVVLDERLEDLEVDEIRRVRVRETWVGGRRVYKRE